MVNKVISQISLDNNSCVAGGLVGVKYTTTGSHYIYNVQNIGTSYEVLNLGDCTNVSMLYLENLSTTSLTMSVDNTDAKSFTMLGPVDGVKSWCLFPPSSSNASGLYVKASGANTNLKVVAFEV